MADRYPRQNPRVAWRVYGGEAVLVSPDDHRLHTLNAVGTVVWQAADGRTPLDEIIRRVCREFEVEDDRAADDTAGFVETLAARGLLTLGDRPDPE